MKIVLASKSPRRIELLRSIFGDFEALAPDCGEKSEIADPEELVKTLAIRKAESVLALRPDALVIGADTVVWHSGRRYGKPKDGEDAKRILRELSGKTHSVWTGVALAGIREGKQVCLSACEESRVVFSKLSEEFIANYVATGIPADKAGAYGIQCEPSPVERYEGNFDNVVGLPLGTLRRLLEHF